LFVFIPNRFRSSFLTPDSRSDLSISSRVILKIHTIARGTRI